MDKYLALLICLAARASTEHPVKRSPSHQYGAPGRNHPPAAYDNPRPQYGVPGAGGNSFSGYSRPAQNYNGRDYDNSDVNYQFNYDVDAPEYGVKFGHQEGRQGDVAQGSYYVLLPDGRTQHVEYVADQNGYRPKISYQGGGGGGGFGGY